MQRNSQDTTAEGVPATKKRRFRIIHAKPGELRVYYGRPDRWSGPDVCYSWGGAGARSQDSHLLHSMFSGFSHRKGDGLLEPKVKHDGYLKELEARGYDLTTIRFSIRKKVVLATPEPSK